MALQTCSLYNFVIPGNYELGEKKVFLIFVRARKYHFSQTLFLLSHR